MRRYAVVFEESAQADFRKSYESGCSVWGRRQAQQWVRQLRAAVSKQPAIMPKGFPLSPEDDAFSEEIRQMAVGRYRLLFKIKGRSSMCSTFVDQMWEGLISPKADYAAPPALIAQTVSLRCGARLQPGACAGVAGTRR